MESRPGGGAPPVISTTNSSPPIRATKSSVRSSETKHCATVCNTRSPARCPQLSLMALKSSMSHGAGPPENGAELPRKSARRRIFDWPRASADQGARRAFRGPAGAAVPVLRAPDRQYVQACARRAPSAPACALLGLVQNSAFGLHALGPFLDAGPTGRRPLRDRLVLQEAARPCRSDASFYAPRRSPQRR